VGGGELRGREKKKERKKERASRIEDYKEVASTFRKLELRNGAAQKVRLDKKPNKRGKEGKN